MDAAALLLDLYGRIPPRVEGVVDGLDVDELLWRPGPAANPIAWLVWHLTRVQDLHIAELLDDGQLWVEGDWASRFGLRPDPHDHGYGHTSEQVAAVRPEDSAALLDYFGAVHARTTDVLGGASAEELDRVVDRSWNPPVTLGVRVVSVADDCLEHVGQAAYVRGLLHSR